MVFGVAYDSIDQAEISQDFQQENEENRNSDGWSYVYILLNDIHAASKKIQESKLEAKECSRLCHQLSLKSDKLLKELNG